VISGAPGKEIFSLIYPKLFITEIIPSSDKWANSKRATYNKSFGETTQAIGPNLPVKL